MSATLRVFLYELRRNGRRRGYLFISVGLPIIALVIFFGLRIIQQSRQGNILPPPDPNKSDSLVSQVRPSGLVDQSGLLKSAILPGMLRFQTVNAATEALNNNQIGSYYVIAPDYEASGKVDMYLDRFNLGNLDNAALKQALVNSIVQKSGKSIAPDAIKRLGDKQFDTTVHTVSETGSKQEAGEGASFAMAYLFGIMLLFSAFTTSGYLMQSVVEEKETRMVEILLSSVRPGQLLAGKILALGLLGLLQMVLWGLTAAYIITRIVPSLQDAPTITVTSGQIAVLLIYFVLGYLYFASAYASIGSISSNMREGPQIAAFVTIPAAIPLWATSIFASAPNGALATGLSIFPLTAPLAMVMRTAITDVPITQIAVSVVLLIVTVLFTMWLAGRLFRVTTLLAGQQPRLATVVNLIRHPGQ